MQGEEGREEGEDGEREEGEGGEEKWSPRLLSHYVAHLLEIKAQK